MNLLLKVAKHLMTHFIGAISICRCREQTQQICTFSYRTFCMFQIPLSILLILLRRFVALNRSGDLGFIAGTWALTRCRVLLASSRWPVTIAKPLSSIYPPEKLEMTSRFVPRTKRTALHWASNERKNKSWWSSDHRSVCGISPSLLFLSYERADTYGTDLPYLEATETVDGPTWLDKQLKFFPVYVGDFDTTTSAIVIFWVVGPYSACDSSTLKLH